MAETCRLPAFQRAVRHLRGVTLAGLPFEPTSSAYLTLELRPLPPTARVRLRLRASGTKVNALLMVVEDSENGVPAALVTSTLGHTKSVPCSSHPQWPVDPAAMPHGCGVLRGVLVVLRQAEPRSDGGARAHSGAAAACAGPPRIVWQRAVRFAELTHLVVDDVVALRSALPPTGALLLRFVDGVCAAAEDIAVLAQAGLLERVPVAVSAQLKPSEALPQDSLVTKVLQQAAALAEAEAANARSRLEFEAQLEERAAHLQRRSELGTHANALGVLREAHAVATADIDDEKRRVEALRAELLAGRLRLEQSAHAEAELARDAARAREAAAEALHTLQRLHATECDRRRELLLELSGALPVGSPASRGNVSSSAKTAAASSAESQGSSPSTNGGNGGSASSSGGGNDDEEVSALLGAAAQFSVHAARLLGLTLRYPVRMWASRSTIDEPPAGGRAAASTSTGPARSSAAFPLYTRGSEPQKLQHGLQLLCRNVQQLLIGMGEAVFYPPKQILPALYLLVQRIKAEGPPLPAALWSLEDAASTEAARPPPATPQTPATPAMPATPVTDEAGAMPSASQVSSGLGASTGSMTSTERLTGRGPMIASPD